MLHINEGATSNQRSGQPTASTKTLDSLNVNQQHSLNSSHTHSGSSSIVRPSVLLATCQAELVTPLGTTQFWEQEEVPLQLTSQFTPAEEECENHFRTTHSRDNSGRYTVRIPLHTSTTKLGDSLTTARR
ncbi:hypothetical protein PV325_012008, partial [Microctonus aethiopoides]